MRQFVHFAAVPTILLSSSITVAPESLIDRAQIPTPACAFFTGAAQQRRVAGVRAATGEERDLRAVGRERNGKIRRRRGKLVDGEQFHHDTVDYGVF